MTAVPTTAPRRSGRRPLRAARRLSPELGMILLALVWASPFYFLIVVSLKTFSDALSTPISIPSSPQFGNFSEAWSAQHLGQDMVNSMVITFGSVVVLLAVSSMTAYAIARKGTRLSGAIYALFAVAIILPVQLGLIPIYIAMRHLHLIGSYLGMIVLYTFLFGPFAVFLYTGFIRALPRDYEEAARIDGAGTARVFLRVVLPLLTPITVTIAILAGISIYNDFFLQLIFLIGSHKQTLPVALYAFVNEYASQWHLIFAAAAITIAPALAFFLAAQRQFMRGFSGGLKS